MPTLRLSRPHDGGGMFRRLRVRVDGREVAALGQGESVTVEVPTGTRCVTGRMDWTSTPPLDVEMAEGTDVHVEVALPFSALWNMVVRPSSALTIRRVGS